MKPWNPLAARRSAGHDSGTLIRLATPDDAEVLATIHVEAWKAAYRGQVPDEHLDGLTVEGRLDLWHRVLSPSDAPVATFVLTEGDRPTGFAHCRTLSDDPDGGLIGELVSLYLDPRIWRQGGGRRLVGASIAWFGSMGCQEARLWVLASNTGAQHFYEAVGWCPDGARAEIDIDGVALTEVRYRIAL